MSKLGINTGITPNDGTGDTLLSGATKINRNFDEIYNYFGDGNNLTFINDGFSQWERNSLGIHTLSTVGIGTIIPRFPLEVGAVGESGVSLYVNNDAIVTGILSVGQGNITINGNTDTITASNIVVTNSLNGSAISGFLTTGSLVGYATEGYVNSIIGTGESYWVSTAAGIHTLSSVGIGTTNPTSKFTIQSTGSASAGEEAFHPFIIKEGTFERSLWMGYATNIGGIGEEGAYINAASTGVSRPIYLSSRNQSQTPFVGIGTDRPTGTSGQMLQVSGGAYISGNLGIGSRNPTSKLTVQGDVSVSGGKVRLNSLTNLSFLSNSFDDASNVINFGNDMVIFNLDDSVFGKSNRILVNEYPLIIGTKGETGGSNFYSGLLQIDPGSDTNIPNSSNVKLGYGDATIKLQTTGYGVSITGGIVASGVITATTFVGNFSGSITDATNLTGGYANASSLNVSGISTISSGRIQADASANLRFGNVAAGSGSGRNIAIGDQVLVSLSGGSGRNIGIGELSYYDTTTGQYNIGIGERAGQKVTTGAYNVILGAYDGNSDNLDIRTSSRNVVIADGEGNIRQYINSSGNVGIKTTVVTEALTVAGIVSATGFYGTLNAGQLTGALPAIDGSALIGVVGSGSGVVIEDDATPVGTAGTINFGSNLSVSFADGTATVSGASSVSAATTAYALAGTPNLNVGVVTANNFVTPFGSGQGFAVYSNPGPFQVEVVNLGGYYAEMGYRSYIESLYIGSALKNSAGAWSIFNTGQALFSSTVSSDSGFIVGDPSTVNINSSGINAAGIITASSFSGSASGLTNIPSGQLTGALPAIDGSALLNVTASGTGVGIHDDQVNVGSATTIDFGTGLDVTFSAGVATVTASGGSLQSRTIVTGVTTSIANNGIGNTDITGFKSYALLKVGLSTAGWLRLYTDSTSRANDVSRSVGEDPAPGSGVIAEVVTTGISTTQIISPFVMGGNLDEPADTTIYASITNLSGSTQAITANLTILQLEA